MLTKAEKGDRSRRQIEAEERAVLDFQFALLDIMHHDGVSKEELARRLKVSKARVSQLFAAGANPTLKLAARIFDSLDRRIEWREIPLNKIRVKHFVRDLGESMDIWHAAIEKKAFDFGDPAWLDFKWALNGEVRPQLPAPAANENYCNEDERVAA